MAHESSVQAIVMVVDGVLDPPGTSVSRWHRVRNSVTATSDRCGLKRPVQGAEDAVGGLGALLLAQGAAVASLQGLHSVGLRPRKPRKR